MTLNSGVKIVISSIDGRLQSLEPSDRDECETALESLGRIGLCKYVVIIACCFISLYSKSHIDDLPCDTIEIEGGET